MVDRRRINPTRRLFYGARANHGGSQTRSEPNEEGKHAADLEEDRTASPRGATASGPGAGKRGVGDETTS